MKNLDGQDRLLPMTILDGMILVASCAVSAWLLKTEDPRVGFMPPKSLLHWIELGVYLLYGPTIFGPVLVALQFARGRRHSLMPGEIAWVVLAADLWPLVVMQTKWAGQPKLLAPYNLWDWYIVWLIWGSPPLTVLCGSYATLWHFLSGRPRHWSHRFGIGITVAQSTTALLNMVAWLF